MYDSSSSEEYTIIPGAICSDFYADAIAWEEEYWEGPGFFKSEFLTEDEDNSGLQWICPNTTSFQILNDYYTPTNQNTLTFEAKIEQCGVAQAKDLEHGVVSYADMDGLQTCESFNDTMVNISDYQVY